MSGEIAGAGDQLGQQDSAAGSGAVDTSNVASTAGAGGAAAQAVRDLTDDTLVRYPGRKDPVKYGELSRVLQAAQTKKEQEIARQRVAHEQAVKEWETRRQGEEARLQQIAAQLLEKRNSGQQGGDYRSTLAAKQWLSGKDAAELYDQLAGAIQPYAEQLQQRDVIIQGLYNYMLNLEKTIQGFDTRFRGQDFESKIKGWVNELGYDDSFIDLAKEIYLAYEGEDLDSEFPTLFKNRVDALQQAFRAADRKRVEDARKTPFKLPGKGGSGVAAKLSQMKGNETAKQQTDMIWDMIQSSNPTRD